MADCKTSIWHYANDIIYSQAAGTLCIISDIWDLMDITVDLLYNNTAAV